MGKDVTCVECGELDRHHPVCSKYEGAEIEALTSQIKDLGEILEDKRRLTRELDVAMNGEEGAAQQASLCDLIPQVKALRSQLKALVAEREGMREVLSKLPYPPSEDYQCNYVVEPISVWALRQAQALLTSSAPSEFVAVRRVALIKGLQGVQAAQLYTEGPVAKALAEFEVVIESALQEKPWLHSEREGKE